MPLSQEFLRRFYARTLIGFNIAGITGFFLGLKLCDWVIFKPEKYELMRESMEDEYWKTHGEPTELEPDIVPCVGNPTKFRKSWIQIKLGKDKYVKRKDQ
jgi:hypothetical protein